MTRSLRHQHRAHASLWLAAGCLLKLTLSPAHAGTKGESMGVFMELRAENSAQEVQALGLGWVRLMYHWTWLEPQPGQWIWAEYDQWIARAHAAGLKVLVVAQGSPAWANGGHGPYDRQPGLNTPPTPEFEGHFARYATELVRHGADAIEIWNEPNGAFWLPQADPARWAKLVVQTARAVKEVKPAMPVITGGVCPLPGGSENPHAPARYLAAALAADPKLLEFCDGIGHHPYVFADDPQAKYPLTAPYRWNPILQTRTMQEVLTKRDIRGKPFWFTEYGVPTGGPFGAVKEEESGEIFRQYYEAFDQLRRDGIPLGPVFFFTLHDSSAYQQAKALEGWEGIFNLQGKPKASVKVIRARAREAE